MTWGNIIAVGALIVSIVALIKSIYTERGASKLQLEVMKGELAIELMKIEILTDKIDELTVEIDELTVEIARIVSKIAMNKNIPDNIANQMKPLSEGKDLLIDKGEVLRSKAKELREFALDNESKASNKIIQNYINIAKSIHEQLDAIQEKYSYRLKQLHEVLTRLKI